MARPTDGEIAALLAATLEVGVTTDDVIAAKDTKSPASPAVGDLSSCVPMASPPCATRI
jgi:hypothetical protein